MAIDGQRGFFRDVCLDENGLLCGIQELINGISQLSQIVNGNTSAIEDISVGLNSIGEDIIEINTNLTTLNEIVSNIDNTTSDINVTVNNIEECCNNISNDGGISDCVTSSQTVVCNIPTRQCTVIVKTRCQPTSIVKPRYVGYYTREMNGFTVMTDSRIELANKKHFDFIERKKRKSNETIVRPTPNLPRLDIRRGYVYPDGRCDNITPKQYIDSKGNIVTVKNDMWVGKPNHSIGHKW